MVLPAAGRVVVPSLTLEANRPFIVAKDDEEGVARALARLAADPGLRRAVGSANREVALREFFRAGDDCSIL